MPRRKTSRSERVKRHRKLSPSHLRKLQAGRRKAMRNRKGRKR